MRLFCTFLYRQCTSTTWKCLFCGFVEDLNTRQRLSSSIPALRYSLLEFNSRKNCQHLANWRRGKERDKVWSSATSLFKWRFHSCCHSCCLRSLILSPGKVCLTNHWLQFSRFHIKWGRKGRVLNNVQWFTLFYHFFCELFCLHFYNRQKLANSYSTWNKGKFAMSSNFSFVYTAVFCFTFYVFVLSMCPCYASRCFVCSCTYVWSLLFQRQKWQGNEELKYLYAPQ